MTNTTSQDSDLEAIRDLMHEAADIVDAIPVNIAVPDGPFCDDERSLSIKQMLAESAVRSWMQGIVDSWPRNTMPIFLSVSATLSRVLEVFGVEKDHGMFGMFGAATADPELMKMMLALAKISSELEALKNDNGDGTERDPMGMCQGLNIEIQRRLIARRTPFAHTLTTLLGPDALLWLTADSQEGHGKIQPHEFSRTGWHLIWSISNQLAIEKELLEVPAEAQHLSKVVVALSWTLAALASHMPPDLFLGERLPHVSSTHGDKLTVSVGRGTHTFIEFDRTAMRSLIEILADGLTNPLLSAADLMWIGAALARVRTVQSGHGDPIPNEEDRFAVFLSHRGRDAKTALAEVVRSTVASQSIFLDCLVLPRGVVNRSFVFGSLARSERVLIVETENFSESVWCRKEAWFADALAARGLAKVERLTLPQAELQVVRQRRCSLRNHSKPELTYPISRRVLRDIDYWGRSPNLHSLKQAGHSTECLAPVQSVFESDSRPDDMVWIRSVGEAVRETLSRVVTATPEAEPHDLWATALQYSLAAFGLASNALSKMEVRRGVDQMNNVLESVVTARLHRDFTFRANAPGCLALIAAATAIQLARFELDPRMAPALQLAIGKTAGLRDGVLLMDVRERGPLRTFHLQILATLVRKGIGSVGIVQDAADEVHRGHVDELPLEILPCVTLYPGMDAPFAKAP